MREVNYHKKKYGDKHDRLCIQTPNNKPYKESGKDEQLTFEDTGFHTN
jgi:hypothetical protein